jgi:leader peptidase (prepilin peptidase)/N-methyltransferase
MIPALGFLFGCFIGSFLNVCIHRLPRNLSVVHPPSRCGACGTRLAWHDNLPILGWLLLRGHCRWCGTTFSPRYLIMELLTGALTALVLWWAMQAPPAPWLCLLGVPDPIAQALGGGVVLAFAYMLLVASVIDLDHLIIPDELTVAFQAAGPALAMATFAPQGFAGLWSPAHWITEAGAFAIQTDRSPLLFMTLGLGGAAVLALAGSLPLARTVYRDHCPDHQRWSEEDHRAFRSGVWWFTGASCIHLILVAALTLPGRAWSDAAAIHAATATLGSLSGWWALYGVGLIGTVVFRRNAMGFGDVKLLAPIGALLGPVGVLYTVATASLIGVLVGLPQRFLKARREIPFGPSLAAGALVVLLFGPAIHRWMFG